MGSIPEKGTYSASRVASVLGLNKYQTPRHIWQQLCEEREPGFNERKGYNLPIFEGNAATRWGNAFEDAIIKLSEEKADMSIPESTRERPFKKDIGGITLSAHIDGMYFDALALHEGKTTNARAYYASRQEITEALDDDDQLSPDFKIVKRWGEPGTDQVPEEYQIQTAVQRICTGAELVKLSVLVFPRPVDEWEDEGWEIIADPDYGYVMELNHDNQPQNPVRWASALSQMGYFHEYKLPSHRALESKIIAAVQEFDANYVKPQLPPPAIDYDDIRRLLTNPMGTVIATPKLKERCLEYSEITRQLGDSGPMKKKKEDLKVEIMGVVESVSRDDWSEPPDKIVVLDPDGGAQLASFAKSGFRTKRA